MHCRVQWMLSHECVRALDAAWLEKAVEAAEMKQWPIHKVLSSEAGGVVIAKKIFVLLFDVSPKLKMAYIPLT